MAKSAGQVEGVLFADVNFASGTLLIEHEAGSSPLAAVEAVVRASGHGIEPLERGRRAPQAPEDAGVEAWLARHRFELAAAAGGVLMALAWLVRLAAAPEWASAALYAAAAAASGTVTVRRALVSLRARVLDMNVLMTVAALGAMAIGEWSEAAMVVFLFAVGGMLESRALERTRSSIRDLMDLAPPTARVLRGGEAEEVVAADVAVGERVQVRPGDRVPLDGVVREGASAVDESPVTGESVPADKAPGDTVFAGTLNTNGLLEVEVTAEAEDTTLARIVHMVEEAQASRAPVQTLVERFTRWYTPAVVCSAALLAVVPPVLARAVGADWGGAETWFYRALVLLVVSCPCALVVSTPVAIVSAIGRATRDGVLVKGGAHLERAAQARAIAFDKTGTLTYGCPEVADVVALAGSPAPDVLETAAALEVHSAHPLARAVMRAASSTIFGLRVQ
ncbi:MAG: cadmium-translocating P-type ATPase, partial [Actinobacteria bacterium]